MRACHCSFALLLLLAFLFSAAAAHAAGTVRLELYGDSQGGAMIFQEWAQVLAKAGIKNVRIQSAQDPGQPRIEVQGTDDSRVYVVTGIVVSRDELQLPGKRFRRGEMAQLAQTLKDLAERGPSTGKEEPKAPFGLSMDQFDRLRKGLAASTDTTTRGVARREAVEKIAARLTLAIKLDAETAEALGDDKVEEELSGLSAGTALACLLRPAGYCLVPRSEGGELGCTAVKARPGLEIWPIGWESKKSVTETLPSLYEFHNVNVRNAPAAATLEQIAKLIKAPILFDHNALARYGIDLAKVKVNMPQSRTTYSLALRKLLFQARLKFEVRCDEAGTPFVWVTTIKSV